MKICVFTENDYRGGVDTFLINLINSWPNSNDKLTLVCNQTHPGLETISEKTVRPLEKTYYNRFFTSKFVKDKKKSSFVQSFFHIFFILLYQLLQYPLLFPWYTISLTIFFRHSNFDRLMVVNGGYPASLLCRCAAIGWKLSGKKTRAILNFHNYPVKLPWYFRLPDYLIDIAVLYSCSYIVGVTKDCINSLKNRTAFSKSNKILYIHNGIEDPLFNLNYKKTLVKNLGSTGRHCLMLANYEKRKGHRFLLEAFKIVEKELPDVCLKIYGHGNPKEFKNVKKIVEHLSLEKKVELNDFAINNFDLIAKADLVVVPSQSHESFGLTIIESMALGVPVVVTAVGGMPEVLKDSNAGFVCPKDDPSKFAETIKKILSDSKLSEELKKNGRSTYEKKYTAKTMSSKYYNLIQYSDI